MRKFLSKLFGKEKETHPFCSAVVAAAGGSSRMGGENKLFASLGGAPVLGRTVEALARSQRISEIVVAAREEDLLAACQTMMKLGGGCLQHGHHLQEPLTVPLRDTLSLFLWMRLNRPLRRCSHSPFLLFPVLWRSGG